MPSLRWGRGERADLGGHAELNQGLLSLSCPGTWRGGDSRLERVGLEAQILCGDEEVQR